MEECRESIRLSRQWSVIAGTFLQQGISMTDMRKDPDYLAAYNAYFEHQQTFPVCSARRHALAEAVKNNPVKPVPAFIMVEDL